MWKSKRQTRIILEEKNAAKLQSEEAALKLASSVQRI
jgi:hypothetical protein